MPASPPRRCDTAPGVRRSCHGSTPAAGLRASRRRTTTTATTGRRRRPSRRPAAGRVTLANGIAAVVSTIPTIRRSDTQPGSARTAPTTGGAPARTRPPPTSATRPAAIAGATSGTMTRLTAGARIASRPNATRITGRVASWAASETPRLSASQRGTRPWPTRSIAAVVGVAQAMSPAVASAESWNPASPMRPGSATRRSVAAQPSAAAARPARPDSRARSTTPAIAPARTTDAEAPAKTT